MTALLWPIVAVALGGWLYALYGLLRARVAVPSLDTLGPPSPPRWPRLSLIVPARNEAAAVEAALLSKLGSSYPDLEVVFVDDRSTDETGAIAEGIAARDPRLRVVHVSALPAGWLGKLHALDRGVAAATGEWLLFCDADVHIAPETLRQTVALAEDRALDHLTLFPRIVSSGFWLDLVLAVFFRTLVVASRVWRVADPRSSAVVGAGAFNLVRRAALERTPGLPWLRLEVADDVALAQMIKQSGGKTMVVHGVGAAELHFYRSVREMAQGAEKNLFPILARYRYGRLIALCLVALVVEVGPWLGLFAGGPVAVASGATVGLELLVTLMVEAWMGARLLPALLSPVGALLLVAMALRSGWLAHRRGGIAWRDTVYPLAELRRGQRLRWP